MSKQTKTIGTDVPPGKKKLTPDDIYDKTWSLNYKACDFLELPSQKISLSHEKPTFIPRKGHISEADLLCLAKNIVLGKVIQSDTPMARFDKNPDALQRHIDFLRLRVPVEEIREYLGKIINGPELDGGYERLDILEAMLEAEEVNPITRKGGLNRKEVVEELRKAIEYVIKLYGGRVSKVTTEVVRSTQFSGENSGGAPRMPDGPKPNTAAILGL